MNSTEFATEIAGHLYRVWYVTKPNGEIRICETACNGRWPRSAAPIGDFWLEDQLERAAYSHRDGTSGPYSTDAAV